MNVSWKMMAVTTYVQTAMVPIAVAAAKDIYSALMENRARTLTTVSRDTLTAAISASTPRAQLIVHALLVMFYSQTTPHAQI